MSALVLHTLVQLSFAMLHYLLIYFSSEKLSLGVFNIVVHNYKIILI